MKIEWVSPNEFALNGIILDIYALNNNLMNENKNALIGTKSRVKKKIAKETQSTVKESGARSLIEESRWSIKWMGLCMYVLM